MDIQDFVGIHNHDVELERSIAPSNLKLTLISNNARESLLGRHHQAMEEGSAESRAIMARILSLCPSAAHDLQLKSHSQLDLMPFRLLVPKTIPDSADPANQSYHNMMDAMLLKSFIAISYCWHNDSWKLAAGLESFGHADDAWPTSRRMLMVIDSLRGPQDGVWIDQMCIDQPNEIEKKHAIAHMDLIYKSARMVVVLLEDILLSTQNLRVIEEVWRDQYDEASWEPPEPQFIEYMVEATAKVFSARWFSRAWCSHELQMAENLLFIIPCEDGTVRLSLEDLDILYHMFMTLSQATDIFQVSEFLIDAYAPILRMSRDLSTKGSSDRSIKPHFARFNEVLAMSSEHTCDRISIALNVTGLRIAYLGPEKTLDECRWLLAVIALCAGDASVLAGSDQQLIFGPSQAASWLQWSDGIDAEFNGGAPRILNFGIQSLCPEFLTSDFILLKTARWQIKSPESRAIDQALCIVYHLFGNAEWRSYAATELMFNVVRALQNWELTAIVSLMACSMQFGVDWMNSQGAILGGLSERVKKFSDEHFRPFKDDLEQVILEACYDEDTPSKITSELFWYFAYMWEMEPFSEINLPEQVHGRDDADEVDEELHQVHDLVCWNTSGEQQAKAVTRALQPYNDEGVELTFAIPKALNTSQCALLPRLWALRPIVDDKGPAWVLEDKHVFWTLTPIQANGEDALNVESQRVYGAPPLHPLEGSLL